MHFAADEIVVYNNGIGGASIALYKLLYRHWMLLSCCVEVEKSEDGHTCLLAASNGACVVVKCNHRDSKTAV